MISGVILPSKHFWNFWAPHSQTRQALQLHPTHQWEGDRAPPHMLMPIWGQSTLRWAAPPFSPPHRWVFSTFFSSLTQPHLCPLRALHVLDHQGKPTVTPAKPISPPTSPIHRSRATSKTLLSNLPSTIPDPHPFKPISLFFSSLTQPHLQDHAKITVCQDRTPAPPRSRCQDRRTWPTHDWSLSSQSTYPFPSIFDHSLFLPLSV